MITVIRFMADWCGPCIAMVEAWKQIEDEFKGKFIFQSVDIDANPDTRAQFYVRMIPTIILVKDGVELARRQTGGTFDELKEWLESEQGNLQ
jgi:thioredoxin-like negative regulator of GroEL